jgi:flagellar motor switch/type III secretory pathway protein FliN
VSSLSPPTAGWTLLPTAPAARAWRQVLPRVHGAALAARAERDRLVQRLRTTFPDALLQQIAAAAEPWWPVRPRRSQGLELVVVHADGHRDKTVLYHRVVRIGRDASCQLQLVADTVSAQHCEIRVDDDHLWVVDLSSSNGTRLNGTDLAAFEPRPLVAGDTVHVRPFRLVVGAAEVPFVPPKVAVSLGEPLTFDGVDPISTLGGPQALWVRVQAGERAAFVRLPHSWLRYAYLAIGQEAPPPPGPSPVTAVDLSLTSFVLQQVAAEASQRAGVPVGLSAVLAGPAVAALLPAGVERWEGARFGLHVDDERHELDAVWPAAQADGRADQTAPEPPPWLQALPFPTAVCAGFLHLRYGDLLQVTAGDILLPDRWLPTGWADQQGASLGAVLLALQGWSADAELRFEKGYYHVFVASHWRVAPKGALMAERADAMSQGLEGASLRLPDELEALVSFELERIAVPLKELLSWEPGATVRLQRAPEDPLRIVLRQGGQERLLGYGRVVVVDEKIGIQIERWLAQE